MADKKFREDEAMSDDELENIVGGYNIYQVTNQSNINRPDWLVNRQPNPNDNNQPFNRTIRPN